MRIEHVVYLSSAGCTLWSWNGAQFVQGRVHTPIGADPGPLAAELWRLKPGPVAVLVDMIDEEHVRETVPRLGRRDLHAVTERKLARAFPRTQYRTARPQGRSLTNPDENHVLLSALTRPEPIRQLLQRLSDARLPVAGVFSPTLLTAQLLDAPARKAPATLLVLRRSNGRLQHSFFRHGELIGSRRLRAQASPAVDDASVALRPLEESLRYFDPTFEANSENPLELLLPAADYKLLSSAANLGEGWHLRPFDDEEMRRRLKIRTAAGCAESECVFIELLRRATRAESFAPPAERRIFEHYRVRTYGKAACLALAAAATAGTLANVMDVANARQELASATATIRQLESLLPDDSEYGAGVLDPVEMQRMVSAFEAVQARQVEPEQVLSAIGLAVNRRPQIRLDSIHWQVGADHGQEGGIDEGTGEESDGTSAGGGAVQDAGDDVVTVVLKGHVVPFGGDYPRAFAEVDALMAALRSAPNVAAVIAREQPMDVSPVSTLTGEVARSRAPEKAAFSLEVTMKIAHEMVHETANKTASKTASEVNHEQS